MYRGKLLAIACLLVVAGILPAQERIPLPAPDPGPPNTPNVQNLAPFLDSPQPPAPSPGSNPPPAPPGAIVPYPPAPPLYGPLPYPPPLFQRDPGDNPDFWVGIEGLLWWSKSQPLAIPLVTTGPASQGASAGNLGMQGTTSLNGRLNYGVESGIRMFGGWWFDSDHTIGLSGGYFILGQQSAGFGVFDRQGNGNFVINEPLTGSPPFTTQVSAPGAETGGVSVNSFSQLGGADLNVQYNLYRANGWTINLLGGYRFLELDETLTINANSTLFATTTYTDTAGNSLAAPPGSTVNVFDEFKTRNQFNGVQVGTEFQYLWGRWHLGGMAKLAIGDMHQGITINGNTFVNPTGGNPVAYFGGNYATLQAGHYSQDRFAMIPEGQLTLGYALTPRITGLIGYNFLFVSSVARPGNQIDNSYDGAAHPAVPMTSSTYWSQGLTANVLFRF